MHSGGFGGGHYYVIIKNMNGWAWYIFNDTEVKKCAIEKINKSHVYCLFYRLRT